VKGPRANGAKGVLPFDTKRTDLTERTKKVVGVLIARGFGKCSRAERRFAGRGSSTKKKKGFVMPGDHFPPSSRRNYPVPFAFFAAFARDSLLARRSGRLRSPFRSVPTPPRALPAAGRDDPRSNMRHAPFPSPSSWAPCASCQKRNTPRVHCNRAVPEFTPATSPRARAPRNRQTPPPAAADAPATPRRGVARSRPVARGYAE
jgi:hypothetical protein